MIDWIQPIFLFLKLVELILPVVRDDDGSFFTSCRPHKKRVTQNPDNFPGILGIRE